MDHQLHLSGPNFAIRPIRLEDAALVVELRSDRQRARYLNPIPGDLSTQEAYLREYVDRAGDFYFVVVALSTGRAEGLIGLYHWNETARSVEIGRWILRPGSTAVVESIWLAYRVAFETLGVNEVYCWTVAQNSHALSFHDSCGLERRRVDPNSFCLDGQQFDRIEHVLSSARWPAIEARLARLAWSLTDRGASCRAA
jgi:RimJ/RimL family protein N-acetyltransferase